MPEYEEFLEINADPDHIFSFVSHPHNLPQYLSTVHHAEPLENGKIRVTGEAAGHKYDSDGPFKVDRSARRMEWGSDGENQYHGWMTVAPTSTSATVTVHLSFTPKPEQEEAFKEQTGSRDSTIRKGLTAALQSIKNLVEGDGGKVLTPADTTDGKSNA